MRTGGLGLRVSHSLACYALTGRVLRTLTPDYCSFAHYRGLKFPLAAASLTFNSSIVNPQLVNFADKH